MSLVLGIRGTNGSGKTHVARRFLPAPLTGGKNGGPVDLVWYDSPTNKEPGRKKRTEGYVRQSEQLGRVGILGPYRSACGGMDQLPTFAICQESIIYMLDTLQCNTVVSEGLLASGTYGSWGIFSKSLRSRGDVFAFCYLSTPLEVCFQRIKARQIAAGQPDKQINLGQVESKFAQVVANRLKALEMGETCYDLPFGGEVEAVIDIMQGGDKAEKHRVRG